MRKNSSSGNWPAADCLREVADGYSSPARRASAWNTMFLMASTTSCIKLSALRPERRGFMHCQSRNKISAPVWPAPRSHPPRSSLQFITDQSRRKRHQLMYHATISNAHLCHLRARDLSLSPGMAKTANERKLQFRVLPDDRTCSYLEIWLPARDEAWPKVLDGAHADAPRRAGK